MFLLNFCQVNFVRISPCNSESYIVCFFKCYYVHDSILYIITRFICSVTLSQHVRGQSALCCQINVNVGYMYIGDADSFNCTSTSLLRCWDDKVKVVSCTSICNMVCNMSFLYADHINNVLMGQAAYDTSPGSQQCMMMRDTKKKMTIALRGNICSKCLSTSQAAR